MDQLLDLARAIRDWMYEFSSTRILGYEIDAFLHFTFAGIVFWFLEGRFGTRRAVYALAAMIAIKETVDVFLKSQLRHIRSPTPEMMTDIGLDVWMGVVGAVTAWGLRRLVR